MKKFIATITDKGQVTIPTEIREYLGLKTHDKVALGIDEEETVQLNIPCCSDSTSLRGAAGNLLEPLSWE